MDLYAFLLAPLSDLAGIGGKVAARLGKRGLHTIGDLLLWTPKAWIEDRAQPIAALREGEAARVVGTVRDARIVGRGRNARAHFVIEDASGALELVFFHAGFMARDARWRPGMRVAVRGVPERRGLLARMAHPEWMPAARFREGVVPVYPSCAGFSGRRMGAWIADALRRLPRAPAPWDADLGMPLHEALGAIHRAPDHGEAWQRLLREEWFTHLALMRAKREAARTPAPLLPPGGFCARLVASLPWPLTPAQEAAWREIAADLASGTRMHRLVQGDVGAGKTVVAALAAAAALEHGFQVAFMAPTEVLARQHLATLAEVLAPVGIEPLLLTGAVRGRARAAVLERLAADAPALVVGTHALASDDVRFARLGLAIVDEQHRFGVRQRWALAGKGEGAHLLSMTATPIPRSLALALYGDLELTVMRGLPPGRKPVVTRVLRDRRALKPALARLLEAGGRAYWITPRVEEDEEGASVLARARQLAAHFPGAGVQALHGRMRADEKQRILEDFARGACRLLVATTVVEVGVNVPEARAIVIEEAERYGLAQLHQLRGRVGRSDAQGYCLLLPSPRAGEPQLARLRLLEDCHDGLRLAEEDLKLRGAGDLVGTRQSGAAGFRLLDPAAHGARMLAWSDAAPAAPPTEDMLRFWKPDRADRPD